MIDECSEENASLYVLGLLSAEDAGRFEQELRADAALQELVSELRESTSALAYSTPRHEPPGRVLGQLLSTIAAERMGQTPERQRGVWLPWALAASLAVVTGILGFQQFELQQQITELRQQDHLSKIRIATLSSQAESAPNSVGTVAWDDAKQQGVLTMSKLPPAGVSQDYQLWIIDPNLPKPVSGGIVRVGEDGTARMLFTVEVPIQNAGKFAISREQKGGALTPQGPIVLLGE